MVNRNKVANHKTGGLLWAISSAQFTFTNVSQVSCCLVSQRLLVFQQIPKRGS